MAETKSQSESEIALALHSPGPLSDVVITSLGRKGLRTYFDNPDQPPTLKEVQQLWQKLIESATCADATENYLGIVCNALSVFLSALLKSQDASLTSFCFTPLIWDNAYNAAYRAFDKGKPKHGLQLLETICNWLNQHPEPLVASGLLQDAAKSLIKTIFLGGLQHNVKVACIALACFLRKTSIVPDLDSLAADSLSEVLLSWEKTVHNCHMPKEDPTKEQSSLRSLILALFITISGLDARSAALKLLKVLCASLDNLRPPRGGIELAVTILSQYITQNSNLLADFAENVLPFIIDSQQSWAAFRSMFDPLHTVRKIKLESDTNMVLYLIVLRIGRLKAYLSQDDVVEYLHQAGVSPSPHLIDLNHKARYSVYWTLFRYANPALRIQAYSLATVSTSGRAPISPSALLYIAHGLRYLHDDNDSYQRGEILSITRRFLKSLDISMGAQNGVTNPEPNADSSLGCDPPFNSTCLLFFRQLQEFLGGELYPAISYPRHILALDTLRIFLSLSSARHCDKSSLLTPLLNLILDPYEDVRDIAAGLCKTLVSDNPSLRLQVDLWKLTHRVQLLSAKTCRHDHADAAARLYVLAHSIEGPRLGSVTAIESLTQYLASDASLSYSSAFPLHALLIGTTYQLLSTKLNEAEELNPDLLVICRRVWHLVEDRLCVDSPETAESDSDSAPNGRGPKDLLAYSWRALRDSSLLLQAILRSTPADLNTLRQIGSLCFKQLTSLRHRGAFSTVAQTFTLCCELARASSDPVCRDLNHDWYRQAVDEIERQAARLTRRSAGLPALINSVLSPQDPQFFQTVIADLTQRSRQPVSNAGMSEKLQLPQVHALNCIKDIIHNSRLRIVNEVYLSQMLQLGADSMTSGTWAIRNCGLMLLNACMIRLEPNGSASKISTGHYGSQSTRNEPLKVATGLLERAQDLQQSGSVQEASSSENIFAALDLVKYIGRAEQDSSYLRQLIQSQLDSHVWAIRDHAARVLVDRLQFEESFSSDFLSISPLPEPEDVCLENKLHGRLLFYRYFMLKLYERGSGDQMDHVLATLGHNLQVLGKRVRMQSSPFTKAALFDLFNDLLAFILKESQKLSEKIETLLDNLCQALGPAQNDYFRARVFLSQALRLILRTRHNHPAALQALCQEMMPYPDTIKHVVEGLELSKPALQTTTGIAQGRRRVEVLSAIVLHNDVPDVRALAISTLADTLETDSAMAEYFRGPLLAHTRLDISHLVEGQDCTFINFHDRELWKATMRLRAFVIAGVHDPYKNNGWHEMSEAKAWWIPLLNHIRDAGQDVTDFATRLSAGLALRSCTVEAQAVPGPISMLHAFQMAEVAGQKPIVMPVRYWSILYSQLNDDDEEVRDLAGQTTSVALGDAARKKEMRLSVSSSWTSFPRQWCARAAREEIMYTMNKMYFLRQRNSGLIMPLALCHMFGLYSANDSIHIDKDDPWALCRNLIVAESVGSQTRRISASINELFSEEKQNLYVDELHQIDEWAQVLNAMLSSPDSSSFDYHQVPDELSFLRDWLFDGLDVIRRMVVEYSDSDKDKAESEDGDNDLFPLGPTYHPDILLLFVRVVSLASVIAKAAGSGSALAKKMVMLREVCIKADVHERLLAAFTLERGSQGVLGWRRNAQSGE